MENPYITHPSTAQDAARFHQQQQAPSSLSFPNAAGHLTPPSSEKDASQKGGFANGSASQQNGAVVPNTPAATPGANAAAGGNVSGIVPTLQYVHRSLSSVFTANLVAETSSLPLTWIVAWI